MNILQYGIPRSGTTVIWQILHEIFPKYDVIKTHSFKNLKCKAVITVRDFRDVLVSQFMTDREKKNKMQCLDLNKKLFKSKEITSPIFSKIIIKKYSIRIEKEEKTLQKYIDIYGNNCLCLRYEKFFENFKYIFDNLENFFNISIKNKQQELIKYKCNLKNNKRVSDMLEDFNQWDINTLIHGHHIINGVPGNWKKVIPKNLHVYLNNNLYKPLKKWSYLHG